MGEALRTHGDLLVQEQHPQGSVMPQPRHSQQQNTNHLQTRAE